MDCKYEKEDLWSTGAFSDSGAGLGNFWKSRVRVQRGAAIKFFFFIIYIFYIFLLLKYSLKTHYMSLVHKTKKEEGKKHKTKKKTQKKQQIFKIKLRNDRFRMFGPHSKSIPVVSAQDSRPISACFSRWPIDPIRHIKTQFWSNQPGSVGISLVRWESAWIGVNWSWVDANPLKKKKKKNKTQTWDQCAGNGIAHASPSRTRVRRPFCRVRAS